MAGSPFGPCGRPDGRAGECSGQLSESARQDHRASGARRWRGPRRAYHRRQIAPGVGPALRGREPGRGGRRDRDTDGGARTAGRLYADDRLCGNARHESCGQTQPRLRRHQGLHADRNAWRHAQRVGRGARGAREHAAGVRRLRQGQSAQRRLRHFGCRHAESPGDGTVQACIRRAQHGGPVPQHWSSLYRRQSADRSR